MDKVRGAQRMSLGKCTIFNIHLDNYSFEIWHEQIKGALKQKILPFSKPEEIIIVILHMRKGFSGTLFTECYTTEYF